MTPLLPAPTSTHLHLASIATRVGPPAAACPESKGCQPALLHGRYCVLHCPCATCQQLRTTVAQRLPRHRIGEVRS